jgi:hypothetical protein
MFILPKIYRLEYKSEILELLIFRVYYERSKLKRPKIHKAEKWAKKFGPNFTE